MGEVLALSCDDRLQSRDRDRRGTLQLQTCKAARIIFSGGSSVLDCVIRDLSAGGAHLQLPGLAIVPTEFVLEVPLEGAMRALPCRIAWRRKKDLGVTFKKDLGVTFAAVRRTGSL